MQLFYAPDITPDSYTLSEQEGLHAIRVLRLGVGEELWLTDGRGNLYRTEVVEAGKRCMVRVVEVVPEFERRPFGLTIACAPTKNSERWEWFVEKAVETGVDYIVPLLCAHSERRTINIERTERVITEATKQSLKAYRPTLMPMTRVEEFLSGPFPTQNDSAQYIKLIAHCRNMERIFISDALGNGLPRNNVIILIGPEGDFSVGEIERAVSGGFTPVSLGTARLRTETAALAAVTIANYEFGGERWGRQ